MPSLRDIVSVVPGLLGLLGAGVGYGTMRQKVTDIEKKIDHVDQYGERIARIDERTKSTDSKVDHVSAKVDRLVERFLPGNTAH